MARGGGSGGRQEGHPGLVAVFARKGGADLSSREKLEARADEGDPEALLELGVAFRDGRWGPPSAAKAAALFLFAGERGAWRAFLALADLTPDPAKAVGYTARAAESGAPEALERHALALAEHRAEDAAEARLLMHDAAKRGRPSAMRQLGQWIASGFGGPAAAQEGLAWVYAAALCGDGPLAAETALSLAETLSAREIAEARAHGRERAALTRRLKS